MSIEFFEKSFSSSGGETLASLLQSAGFADVTQQYINNVWEFSSAAGIYGVNSFSVNTFYSTDKLIAVKDDVRKALYVYPSIEATNTIDQNPGEYVIVIIVDGVLSKQPAYNTKFSQWYNVTGGAVKSAFDTSEVLLTPLIDKDANILKPFYISANRVKHNTKTVVTDANGNAFTSLGNLFYIKNA